jgi:NAD(P)H-hydrate epimerase
MQPSAALTREQVRAFDERAIMAWRVPSLVLMENAGRNAAQAISTFLGGAAGKSIVIVCGTGNNGGDGFVIARHLAKRGGRVLVVVVGDSSKFTDDARTNVDILAALTAAANTPDAPAKAQWQMSLRQLSGDGVAPLAKLLAGADVVVDALGGTGITGPLRGDTAAAVEQINASGRQVVAIDIPTGLDCDTGAAPEPTIRAAMTVTMVARKAGFDKPGAAQYTGKVVVVDIGVPTTG